MFPLPSHLVLQQQGFVRALSDVKGGLLDVRLRVHLVVILKGRGGMRGGGLGEEGKNERRFTEGGKEGCTVRARVRLVIILGRGEGRRERMGDVSAKVRSSPLLVDVLMSVVSVCVPATFGGAPKCRSA